MASTVIGPKKLHEESDDVLIRRLQYVPMFAQNMERGAGDLVGDLEQIIKHELWRKVGCNSMDEYAFKHLNGHTTIWCHEVIKVFREEWKRKRELSVKDAFARADRNEQIHKDREAGMTQQAIADKHDLSQRQISNILEVKPAIAQNTSKKKRKQICYQIYSGTKPSKAAEKIVETFGIEYALELCDQIKQLS